jgi:hypothetical protein
MGKAHPGFEKLLDNFRREVDVLASYVYSENAVQHAASLSPKLLSRLNVTAQFWLIHDAACQTAAFMTLGRIFDAKSKHNVERLIDSFYESLAMFQKPALESRKMEGQTKRPDWIDDYLRDAHYPTKADVTRLRKLVRKYAALYQSTFDPARDKYFAHRAFLETHQNNALFSATTYRHLWRLTTFLVALHEVLREQLLNGRKPVIRPMRYSIRELYKNCGSSGTRECMVRDVRTLMRNIMAAERWEREPKKGRESIKRPKWLK